MVSRLTLSKTIRSRALETAFLAVDRALFLPASHPDPYSGAAHQNVRPSYLLKDVRYYVEALEALCSGIVAGKRSAAGKVSGAPAFLVVNPASGYVNCIVAVVLGRSGHSVGVDRRSNVIEHAQHCMLKWQASLEVPMIPLARIDFIAGDVHELGQPYDRIFADVDIGTVDACESLLRILKVGGLMVVLVQSRTLLFERRTPSSARFRDLTPAACGSEWRAFDFRATASIPVSDSAPPATGSGASTPPPPAVLSESTRAVDVSPPTSPSKSSKTLGIFLRELGL
jgi:protein-L-isoaspartate O-methyltransferase